jgi:hypothetical protein
MSKLAIKKFKLAGNAFIAAFLVILVSTFNTSPAMAYAGTLENGNLAYAQGSGFDKGEACNYLPGFETGYDAWHFVLTTRGATFQQSTTNPAIAINLNFVFMRQDGSLFVIKSGAWVQTGKGAYTYTRVEDRIRMVMAGTVAQINGSDSGMRLSHTCPGSGVAPAATTSPTPTPTATTASPTPTATRTTSASPTPTATTASPSPSASRTTSPSPTPTATTASPSPTPTASASTSASPTPSATPSSTVTPTLRPQASPTASAVQTHPAGRRNPLPTPTATPQGLVPSPTPSPTATASRSASPTPSTPPTNSPAPSTSPEPTPSEEPSLTPPTLPTPPKVEDPKNVIYVEPQTPKEVKPVDPPASPIVVTIEPKLGKVEVNPSGSITYTPPAITPKEPVVDLVEFKYTNLSGATVVVRKEFIITQKGDVPSIIQTGEEEIGNNYPIFLLSLLIALTTFGLVRRKI